MEQQNQRRFIGVRDLQRVAERITNEVNEPHSVVQNGYLFALADGNGNPISHWMNKIHAYFWSLAYLTGVRRFLKKISDVPNLQFIMATSSEQEKNCCGECACSKDVLSPAPLPSIFADNIPVPVSAPIFVDNIIDPPVSVPKPFKVKRGQKRK